MPTQIPTISLKAAPLQFAEFKPVAYTPQEANIELLNRSMEKIEARNRQSRASADAFVHATNDLRSKLNPLEYEAFDNRVKDIRNIINDRIQLGDTESAILLASDLGRSLAEDSDLQNRIATNESWKEYNDKIQKGPYTNYTKRRADDINRYRYDGTGTFTPEFTPVPDMSLTDVFNAAVSATPTRSESNESSKTTKTSTFVDKSGKLINRPDEVIQTSDMGGNLHEQTNIKLNTLGEYSSTTTARSSGSSFTEKRKEDMVAKFKDMLSDPNISGALRQNFETMLWLRNKANDILNDPNATEAQKAQARTDLANANSSLENEDGFTCKSENDFDKWIDYHASRYFGTSAYRHTGTKSSTTDGTDYNSSIFTNVAAARNLEAEGRYAPGRATSEGASINMNLNPTQQRNYNAATAAQYF